MAEPSRRTLRTLVPGAAAALAALAAAAPARAHEGPPYAIAMDERAGPYEVSVWTDPDVGEGTFWVVLTTDDAAAAGATVRVRTRPRDAAAADRSWADWPARPEPSSEGETHFARVPFPRAEWVEVEVVVDGPRGGGRLAREVEVTPPGQGPWLDFVLYLFPFVAVGALLLKAAIVRRRLRADAAGGAAP